MLAKMAKAVGPAVPMRYHMKAIKLIQQKNSGTAKNAMKDSLKLERVLVIISEMRITTKASVEKTR